MKSQTIKKSMESDTFEAIIEFFINQGISFHLRDKTDTKSIERVIKSSVEGCNLLVHDRRMGESLPSARLRPTAFVKRQPFKQQRDDKKMLTPLSGTAEEKRLRWDRSHPIASRSIAAAAWLVLVAALITQIPNTINSLMWTLSHLPYAPSLAPVPSFPLPE